MRDVSKRAVAMLRKLKSRTRGTVARQSVRDEENVFAPVGVVVEESTTGAQRFRQEFSAKGTAVMPKRRPAEFVTSV